jgi:hypothetical protein
MRCGAVEVKQNFPKAETYFLWKISTNSENVVKGDRIM